MTKLDADHLRRWTGRTETRSEDMTPALAERFRATLDLPGPVAPGDAAPLLIHFCLAPSLAPTAELGPDGHPARGGFLPPVPLPRRMWAGGSFRFHDDIRIGETVSRQSTIRDVTIKEGRSGTLCFVTVDHEIRSAGRLAVEERQDIVYRGAARPDAPATAPEPAPHGDIRVLQDASATLLFRYSALTFNGHRIHYDAPYARGVEGYPGLVVHGPLQATLLVHLAARLRGARPTQFEFRSISTLFDDVGFTLNASADADGMMLWTAYADGPVAMQARAAWNTVSGGSAPWFRPDAASGMPTCN
ncbi:FAS1-like dehydratase domain-containing protein [Szabonella alba]|uniref:MaoC family dehydratase N-terminal domain-containing protein n=1 Tax=Szabonella alba TaxID=2804194 RepID=A0A8K0Y2T1_9RHOB|nr:MaoC family dehydratase N-terminal domain-containing protein [Szabonella alba]MBL4919114.1 MaoC family dehydratase N-terminal domain-containing protein [Szabonella alba]